MKALREKLRAKRLYWQIRPHFDRRYYLRRNPDVRAAKIDPLAHYFSSGWIEGRDPTPDFSTRFYLKHNPDIAAAGINPFAHYIRHGRDEGRAARDARSRMSDRQVAAAEFDEAHYLAQFDSGKAPDAPLDHFLSQGWKDGHDPNGRFSTRFYLKHNPDVAAAGINPFVHYLRHGRDEGRAARDAKSRMSDRQVAAAEFDEAHYLAQFDSGKAPDAPLDHFLSQGWKDGRDPNGWFSTRFYLKHNPDVAAAGINPFVHYIRHGRDETRVTLPPAGASASGPVCRAQAAATQPGPYFQEFDPGIARGRAPLAKVLAYYLPQFHSIPENDAFWGPGFTEWRNVARGLPRVKGQVQPRIPRDMGFYSLDDPDVMRRQIELARAAGIYGFCFYYYWFGGRRVLQKPVEHLLADPSLEVPFALMWANENWTRTWDGMEREVLLEQDYDPARAEDLVDDLARHFKDPRYIRIDDRPLVFIYRPGQIPETAMTIVKWRRLFETRHQETPLIMMAQGFGDTDPNLYGLDGAIEFPPHKLCHGLHGPAAPEELLDGDFSGQIIRYDDVVARARDEPVPDYPLIRTSTPCWDNEARRPGRGTMMHGSTPEKFERWVRQSVGFAREHPVCGESIIAVNAWNEWAEGAYLEPDVHFGAAYLNALSRAVHGATLLDRSTAHRLVLVGHDAYRHGAQILVANLARVLTRQFGVELVILLCGPGPMVQDYEALCETHVLPADPGARRRLVEQLAERGFSQAIVNSTVSGPVTPVLKGAGFHVTALIHELGRLISEYGLAEAARAIVTHADRIVFPAEVVRDGFLEMAGEAAGEMEICPQGLYRAELLSTGREDGGIRAELGLPAEAKIVINVGYADLRKGFDQFVATAQILCDMRDDIWFVWLGGASPDVDLWFKPDARQSAHADRFRFVGHVSDVERWYAAADLFFLSAREDPFPSVVLEALAVGLPVVGYAGTGGCDGLIARHGALVPKADHTGAARAIAGLIDQPEDRRESAMRQRRDDIRQNYLFDRYAHDLLRPVGLASALGRVSVIVPNYNYAHCLEERLRSIFAQSYPVFEIIVLDDASRDDSVAVIERVAAEAGREIELVVNEDNSGSPFKQWRRGLELARGDHIWIAEADDVADPEFLAALMRPMTEDGAEMGFSDSWQIDETGKTIGDSYIGYANAIRGSGFDDSFLRPGHEVLQRYLAVKNIILNVSSVVFRKAALAQAMARAGAALDEMKVAGDWRIYSEICATDGKIAYVARALNGHRRHAGSVTHALEAERHLAEIARMQAFAGEIVGIDKDTAKAQEAHLSEARAVLESGWTTGEEA